MIVLTKKSTMATVKSFIRKNRENLFVRKTSSFSGMSDMVEKCEGATFKPAEEEVRYPENSLGIKGVWVVGSSRDLINPFRKDGFEGYEIYNACGSFSIAIPS